VKFPVVGMQHRFPSAMVLSLIPPGTEFFLVREPENPHDTNAIQVWVESLLQILESDDIDSIESACREQDKETPDWNEPFMIGYIKAVSVSAEVVGAEVLAPRIDSLIDAGAIDSAEDIPVVLVYGESGRPAVEIVEEEGKEEEAPVAEVDDEDLEEENYDSEDEDEAEDEDESDEEEDEEDETTEDPGELVPEDAEDFTKADHE
jgi:hypothetical protein